MMSGKVKNTESPEAYHWPLVHQNLSHFVCKVARIVQLAKFLKVIGIRFKYGLNMHLKVISSTEVATKPMQNSTM